MGIGGRTKFLIAAVAATVAMLGLAAPATAATFCVSDPACVTAGGTNEATLQLAFDAAGMGPANTLDRVEIGAATLPAGGSAKFGNPVEVVGEGPAQTIVGGGPTIISLGDTGSSIRDLSIVLDGSDTNGLVTRGPATRVTVSGSSTASETGVLLTGAATISSALTVSLPTTDPGGGIGVQIDSAALENSQITGDTAIFAFGTGSVVRRVKVVAGGFGIKSFGGTVNLDQVSVRVMSATGVAMDAASDLFGISSTIVARHVTAVGPGSGTGASASTACAFFGGAAPADLTLRNVILRGFATDLVRAGVTGCSTGPATGPASIDVAYSIFDPAKITQSGPGTLTQGAGNLNADPLFVNAAAGNFHLGAGSPAIDTGDPAALAIGESTTDLDGNPRVTDGNGDGTLRRDIGAFEVQTSVPPPPPPGDRTPPDTTITKATVKSKKRQATFEFTSTETGSTFSCKLDGKPVGACTSPRTYKKLKVGKHSLQVTATDAAGNADATAAVKKFKIK